jgi:hypothetical protein
MIHVWLSHHRYSLNENIFYFLDQPTTNDALAFAMVTMLVFEQGVIATIFSEQNCYCHL